MAKLFVNGLDGLLLSLEELKALPGGALDEMLLAQAEVVEEAQVYAGMRMGVHRTGMTLSSITHGKPLRSLDGKAMYVYPRGKNAQGVRNGEVAFVNEYGKRGQAPRPFIREANEAAAPEAARAAEELFNRHIDKLGL